MLPPPGWSNPYQLIDQSKPNPGSQGVRVGWDVMRQFWGQIINQAWADLDTIENGGTPI